MPPEFGFETSERWRMDKAFLCGWHTGCSIAACKRRRLLPSWTHASLKLLIEFIQSSNCLQISQANVDTLVLFAGSIFTSSHTSPLYLINEEFFQLSVVATDNVRLVEDFFLFFFCRDGCTGRSTFKKGVNGFLSLWRDNVCVLLLHVCNEKLKNKLNNFSLRKNIL